LESLKHTRFKHGWTARPRIVDLSIKEKERTGTCDFLYIPQMGKTS